MPRTIPDYPGLQPECPETVEHALVHLKSARHAFEQEDDDQLGHELETLTLILYAISLRN